jgi:hypothetical protein
MLMVIRIKRGESLKSIRKKLSRLKTDKGFPASKFTGLVKSKEDAVAIQRRLRDEW